MSIFKAYDIRGVYNSEFNKEDVYKIGYFLPTLLKTDRVLVGYDCRISSTEIFKYLCLGITDSGADVYSIGASTTPMVYFATAVNKFDASVEITASHNSKEYNGFKVSTTGAIPVGYDTGLAKLENMVKNEEVHKAENGGRVIELNIRNEYLDYMKKYIPAVDNLNIAVDCSNGMTSMIIKDVLGNSPSYIYDEMDGSFPNHEPNPLDQQNVKDLQALVKKNSCDIGIIYDGDGDRVVFVDEKGQFIPPDLIIGVIGEYYLKNEKGNVLHDIRTSKGVSEYIKKLGGTPYMWKVGHAYAKVKLREINGIFGGELAGHYYFRDFFNCDSGILASLIVLNVLSDAKCKGKTFSSLISPINTYYNSGEINFKIENKVEAIEKLKSEFVTIEKPTATYDFDGYRIEFRDWWFNVRSSNTEPYLRLVVESNDQLKLQEKLAYIKKLLEAFSS